LPRAEFSGRVCACRLFYIVKRGSTWGFLIAARTHVLVEDAADPGQQCLNRLLSGRSR
jgi:hypothetical protein